MKKGEIVSGVCVSTAFSNKGIVMVEEQKVHVKDTLPGQKVSVMIQKTGRGKIQGRLLDV